MWISSIIIIIVIVNRTLCLLIFKFLGIEHAYFLLPCLVDLEKKVMASILFSVPIIGSVHLSEKKEKGPTYQIVK